MTHTRTLTLKAGTELTFAGLSALDALEIEKELGQPLDRLGDSGMKGVLTVAWRMACSGGFDGSLEDFAGQIDLMDDLPGLNEVVGNFFERATSEEKESATSSGEE